MASSSEVNQVLFRRGRRLQYATIAWNLMEVFVTIGLGIAAGSLALVAFGLDSLVEVFASVVVESNREKEFSNRKLQRYEGAER